MFSQQATGVIRLLAGSENLQETLKRLHARLARWLIFNGIEPDIARFIAPVGGFRHLFQHGKRVVATVIRQQRARQSGLQRDVARHLLIQRLQTCQRIIVARRNFQRRRPVLNRIVTVRRRAVKRFLIGRDGFIGMAGSRQQTRLLQRLATFRRIQQKLCTRGVVFR